MSRVWRHLQTGNVGRRRRFISHIVVLCVLGHSDDLELISRVVDRSKAKTPSDRIRSAEKLVGHSRIHHRNLGRGRGVLGADVAAQKQPDLHGLEKIGTDNILPDRSKLLVGLKGVSLDYNAVDACAAANKSILRQACRPDARKRLDAVEQLCV